MRISKKFARYQYEWFEGIAPALKPTNIEYANGELSYDFIEGRPATGWHEVWTAALYGIWHGDAKLSINPGDYIRYVTKVAETVMPNDGAAIHRALMFISIDDLTPVTRCHGDMTFANCIRSRGGYRFIDPGDARGLPCREIDEAKMLQSLDGFGVVYRGWPDPMAYPKMPTRRVHWVLLMSHYIRLLAHVQHKPSLQFARQRIREIMKLWD